MERSKFCCAGVRWELTNGIGSCCADVCDADGYTYYRKVVVCPDCFNILM